MGGRLGEILIVVILVLIFFGPNKLPEIARSIGQAFNEFKKASNPNPEPNPADPNANPALATANAAPVAPAKAPARRKSASRRKSKSSK